MRRTRTGRLTRLLALAAGTAMATAQDRPCRAAVRLSPFTYATATVNLDIADPPGGALFGLAVTQHAVVHVNNDDNLFVLH